MADQKFTPREKALQHLRLAVDTGVRGPNRDAIIVAIEELEASRSGTLADMHYRNLKPGVKLIDPERPGLLMRHGKRTGCVWIYRYDHPGTHKQVELQFGVYPKLGVAEARETWQQLRRQRLAGEEPRLANASSKAEMTMSQLVKRYMTDYARKVKRSWAEDERLLQRHVLPRYGGMPVSKFGPEEVAAILLEIKERGAPREAEKVRAVISTVFNVGRGRTRKIPLLRGAFLNRPLVQAARLALGVAGLGLLIPVGTFPGAWWSDIGGLLLGAVVLGPEFLAKRRERAASAS